MPAPWLVTELQVSSPQEIQHNRGWQKPGSVRISLLNPQASLVSHPPLIRTWPLSPKDQNEETSKLKLI